MFSFVRSMNGEIVQDGIVIQYEDPNKILMVLEAGASIEQRPFVREMVVAGVRIFDGRVEAILSGPLLQVPEWAPPPGRVVTCYYESPNVSEPDGEIP